ncbi:hypothetical protein B4U80_11747, partial [Leptotrombidium deliense]
MASILKPLYLANSFEILNEMVDIEMRNTDTFVGCYVLANKSMAEGDQELAFILFKRSLNKYFSQENFNHSIISIEQIEECIGHTNNLAKSLQERYAQRKMHRCTDGKNKSDVRKDEEFNSDRDNVVPKNTINFHNASPDLNEHIIRSIFRKHGKIKKCGYKISKGHGHGFVEFKNRDSAEMAILVEDGVYHKGFPINVHHFSPKKKKIEAKKSNQNTNNGNGNNDANSIDCFKSCSKIPVEAKNSHFKMITVDVQNCLPKKVKNNKRRNDSPKISITKTNDKTIEFDSFTKLFISNIKHDISKNEELKRLFCRYGKINYVRIHRTKDGQVTGYAEIQFERCECAAIALREMNNFSLPSGHKMGIDVSRRDKGKNNNVNSASSSAFTSKNASTMNSDAESSDDQLKDASSLFLNVSSQMRKMNVVDNVPESEVMGNNLYVSGFQGEIKNDLELENLFKQFGSVTSVKCIVEKNEFGDLTKNFGYVCFEKDEDAKVALQTMNHFKFRSGVKLRVQLYKPKYKRNNYSKSLENICAKSELDIDHSFKS